MEQKQNNPRDESMDWYLAKKYWRRMTEHAKALNSMEDYLQWDLGAQFIKDALTESRPQWESPYQCFWRDEAFKAQRKVKELERKLIASTQKVEQLCEERNALLKMNGYANHYTEVPRIEVTMAISLDILRPENKEELLKRAVKQLLEQAYRLRI